jgi:hypothetical protein
MIVFEIIGISLFIIIAVISTIDTYRTQKKLDKMTNIIETNTKKFQSLVTTEKNKLNAILPHVTINKKLDKMTNIIETNYKKALQSD